MNENDIPKTKTTSKYKIADNLYKCECGREFNNHQSLNAHFSYCDIHNKALNKKSKRVVRSGDDCNFSKAWLGEEEFFRRRIEHGKKLKAKYASGELVPSFKNRKHLDASKQKTRNSTIKYLESTLTQPRRYNINSISVLDKISKDNNWNLQHAENGGEVKLDIGYYLDAYDKDLNIVVEYDEPAHYKDVYNNILKEKDIYRMNLIIKHLNCDFYRYNEKTKQLIKYT